MPSTFTLQMRKFENKVNGRMDLAVQKIGLDTDKAVVKATPVDTGRARGGWNVGVNSVNLEEREPEKNANSVSKRNEPTIKKAKAGDVLYLSNNVEYIEVLDKGRHVDDTGIPRGSVQAPNGMVAKTLRRWPQIIRESVTQAKRERP